MCLISSPEPPGCVSSGERLLWEQVRSEDDASSAVPTRHGRVSETHAALQVLRQGVCLRHDPGQFLTQSFPLVTPVSITVPVVCPVRGSQRVSMLSLSYGSWMLLRAVWSFMWKHLPLFTSGQRLSSLSHCPLPHALGPTCVTTVKVINVCLF